MKREHRREIQFNTKELDYLKSAANEHHLELAVYIRHAALRHTAYIEDFKQKSKDEYFKYQFNDAPEKLHRVFTKEDLINEEIQNN